MAFKLGADPLTPAGALELAVKDIGWLLEWARHPIDRNGQPWRGAQVLSPNAETAIRRNLERIESVLSSLRASPKQKE